MRARTLWLVTGALGVVGVSGIAIVNAAVPDDINGDGAVVTSTTEVTSSIAPSDTRTATAAPSEGPSGSPSPTVAPSAPSPVPAESAASAASGG
jgi:hypothetical protein